jgi:RNA polymerase sigma factor (sigma-70 family)
VYLGDEGVVAVDTSIDRKGAQELLTDFHRTGDQAPFAEIVRRYGAMVYAHCLRVTKNRHDAEDAAQAVFLTLASQRTAGRDIRMLGPWLQQVAYRVSLDMRRSRKRRVAREERMAWIRKADEPDLDPVDATDSLELGALLRQELDALPPKFRLPMILHYYGGMSREEMAEELKCKVSTLGVRLFRGRQMLAKRLAKRGVVLSTGVLAMALARAIKETVGGTMIAETARVASAARLAGDAAHVGISSAQLASWAHPSLLAINGFRVKWPLIAVMLMGSALSTTAAVVSNVDPAIIWPTIQARLQGWIDPLVRPLFRSVDVPVLVSEGAPVEKAAPRGSGSDNSFKYPAYALGPVTAPAVEAPAAAVAVVPVAKPAAATSVRAPVTTFRMGVVPVGRSDEPAAGGAKAAPPLRPAASKAEVPDAATPVSPVTASAAGGSAGGGSGEVPVWVPNSVGVARPPVAPGMAVSTSRVFRSPGAPEVVSRKPSGAPGAVSAPVTSGTGEASGSTGHPVHLALAPVPATPTISNGSPKPVGVTEATGAAAPVVAWSQDSAGTGATGLVYGYHMASAGSAGSSSAPPPPTYTVTSMVLSGYGAPGVNGELNQNGQVVADGRGADRTLDLSAVARVANTIDNPAVGGTNGWYAVNRGKLVLPPVHGAPEQSVFTWGEDPNDPVLDLVNSVRVGVGAGTATTGVNLALLSPGRSDVPAGLATGGVIGVWSMDVDGGTADAVDLSVRYDDAAVRALGGREGTLQLWAFENGWRRIPAAELDLTNHIISSTITSPTYVAVIVPEPSGFLVLAGATGGIMALARRRRSRR